MKCDQVAFYCFNDEQVIQVKHQLGLTDEPWVTDTVYGQSTVTPINCGMLQCANNVAELQFCYKLGIEIEILRYISGPHWHEVNPLYLRQQPFVSHTGFHLEDGESFPEMPASLLVQETFTQTHTGKFLTDPASPGYGRRYHYRVHELSPGTYLKFIRRIHPK